MQPMPVLSARKVLSLLRKLGYSQKRQSGSHRVLDAPGRKRIVFAFHDQDDVPRQALRHMLINRAGLTEQEAIRCLHQ